MVRVDRVGIYAPYDWDEATYAALRLATLIRQHGMIPSYRAYGKRLGDHRFHDEWDHEVTWHTRKFRGWIEAQRVIIWFGLHKRYLEVAKAAKVKNILVPMLHRVEHHSISDLRLFDQIICPNLATQDVLTEVGLRKVINVKWDAGLTWREREYPSQLDIEKVLVVPEWPITNEWGLMLAYTIRHLLDAESNVNVTILQMRQWPKTVNRAMLDLTANHCCRVEMLRGPTYHNLLQAYQHHDWVLYLPEKVNIGVRLAEAFSQGLPVVSLSLPPVEEFVKHDESAHLIRCEYTRDLLGRPTARLNTHDTAEEIHETIGDRENWYRLVHNRKQEVILRQEYFEHMWSSMLSPF